MAPPSSSSSIIRDGQEEPLEKMSKIVASLMARPDAAPFLEPVDWRGLELWDYPSIIKKQMDLGTVQRQLQRQQYPTAAQCASDVRLVFHNCMTYNAPHSDFWLLAKSLLKRFDDRYRRLKQEFYVGEEVEERVALEDNDNEEEDDDEGDEEEIDGSPDKSRSSTSSGHANAAANMDARALLASNLLLLNGMELGHVLHVLERKSPHALLKSTIADKLEINLDEVNATVLDELSAYAHEQTLHRKKDVPSTTGVIEDISNRRKRKR